MKQSGRTLRLDLGLALLLVVGGLMAILFISLQTQSAALNDPGTPERTRVGPATRTLMPNRGVYLSEPREILPGRGISATQALYPARTTLEANTLATTIEVPGGHALVLIDLQTGQMQQVVFWPGMMVNNDVHLAGPYVVWQDEIDPLDGTHRLHVYDRELQREVFARDGFATDASAKDGLLVWRAFDSSSRYFSLVGYELQAQTQFSVTAPMTVTINNPRICSREWLIYLYDVHYGPRTDPGWSALRAHNLSTGEEITVTERVYLPLTGGARQHDCDGQWATWIEASQLTGGVLSQHVYDFVARTTHTLDLPLSLEPSLAQVSGNIVLNEETGYDLLTERSFSLPYGSRHRVVIWRDQIVWWTDPEASGPPMHLYVASIQRSP